MKHTGPTNPLLKKQIAELKVHKAAIWKNLAYELERATRKRREVNLSRINRFVKDGETVLVPGKVLAAGTLRKRITIAAWSFSGGAAEEIRKAGGTIIAINELVKKYPTGKGVRIIG
ncbi:MAG: 50S ribosomal protein L18e [archaeon]